MVKAFLFAASLSILGSVPSFAGSRVIKDNRINDLAIPPSLGRGYSISTNTYQSVCLKDIQATTPSYNMKYNFKEIEQSWETEYSRSLDLEARYQYLFLKSNVDIFVENSGSNTYYYHYIFANISVDSYYNSVNEADSPLSDSAASLLAKGDTVSFFDSCGPYYIRSLGRHSNYYALFSYRSTSATRETEYEVKVKTALNSWFGKGGTDIEWQSEFKRESEEKRLNIRVWANGLGKGRLANLIPTDLDSFKESIEEAIKTMQDPDTGIVTSMEVSPWVENTHFQQALILDDESETSDFIRRRNLEANSELIAEIDRIDRAQVDQYSKALTCRRNLEENYLDLTGDYAYDPAKTWFHDLSAKGNQSKQVTLGALDASLSDAIVKGMDKTNEEFLTGDGVDFPGAVACIVKLEEAGLEEVHHRTIEECTKVRSVRVPLNPILDRFCMPELARIEP